MARIRTKIRIEKIPLTQERIARAVTSAPDLIGLRELFSPPQDQTYFYLQIERGVYGGSYSYISETWAGKRIASLNVGGYAS